VRSRGDWGIVSDGRLLPGWDRVCGCGAALPPKLPPSRMLPPRPPKAAVPRARGPRSLLPAPPAAAAADRSSEARRAAARASEAKLKGRGSVGAGFEAEGGWAPRAARLPLRTAGLWLDLGGRWFRSGG
jgi:hypothetical protein